MVVGGTHAAGQTRDVEAARYTGGDSATAGTTLARGRMLVNQLIDLPPGLRSVVEDELEVGESVQWSAQPRPRRLVLSTLPIVLFAIPWTAFAIFWICGASGWQFPTLKGPGGFFPLFGLPFVLIGCAMFTAPLWALRKARRMLHLITNRRAIAFEGGWSTTVHSYGPEVLGHITRRQRFDGSGDILLDQRTWHDGDGHHRASPIGFLGIENVKEVDTLLRRLAATARPVPRQDG